jgi:hypothetical protein
MKRTELEQAIEEIITEILSENELKTQSLQCDQEVDGKMLQMIKTTTALEKKMLAQDRMKKVRNYLT